MKHRTNNNTREMSRSQFEYRSLQYVTGVYDISL